jgi:cobalt/nickel transport system permease protein
MEKNEYVARKDRDRYIGKTILALAGILSRMRRKNTDSTGFMHRINPVLKLAFTLLLVVFLSLSQKSDYIFLLCAYALLSLSLLHLGEIKRIAVVVLFGCSFTFIVLLPSFFAGNITNTYILCLKVAGTLVLVNHLVTTTQWRRLSSALKFFFVPDIFILIFDVTILYIAVLGDSAVDTLRSLKLRSVGINREKHRSLTSIIGTLFLKSKDMAESMFEAMKCRGFSGEYKSVSVFTISIPDFGYSCINAALIVLFFLLNGGTAAI